MRHRLVIAGFFAAIALLSAVYFVGRREPVQELADRVEPDDNTRLQSPSVAAETAPTAEGGNPDAERAATEVRVMSSTFRNSTFLVAIRRAGYYCDDVASVSESADGVWLASCADKGGYVLSVLATDEFHVRPIAHYVDGLVPIYRDPPRELERSRQ